jgi:hypothetical protein
LKGKLVNEYSETVNTTFYEAEFQTIYAGLIRNSFRGSLRTPIKIRNIPNKGFCITYTESNFVNGTKIKTGNEVASASCKQKIQVFDFNGNSIWKGQLPESKVMYSIPLTSENNIYILRKNYKKDVSIPNEGEYDLLSLNSNNGNVQKQEKIGDNSKNSFHVLNFSNELNLDMPVISGLITKQGASIKNIHYASRGEYYGVFNIKAKDSTFKKQISYWSDGQLNPEISKSSYIKQTKTYPNISYSFPDAEGNVYYIGPGIVKKTRWGSVTAAVLTSPTLVIPAWIFMFGGIHKYKNKDELVLKQDVNGKLSFHSSQVVNNNKIKHLTGNPNTEKSYFTVNQNKYLVINDREDIFVLDIPNKSLVKKIPHKQGDNKVEVFKAKEGHIMLSEHNSEDGSTKLSIEAL